MIVVIQCAARKHPAAGHLMTSSGQPVFFVADPQAAPAEPAHVYARPDDRSDEGVSWRHVLLSYNKHPEDNPLGLYPAYQLYKDRTYKRLADHVGVNNLYILSAGWGLIRAGFLTPQYDITFSQGIGRKAPWKRRRKRDRYEDYRMLPDSADDIVFFGGNDYLPLFCALTNTVRGRTTVFYNSKRMPDAPGCRLERFETTTRTNWHYECAKAYLDGDIHEPKE
jgi:hypothetical protein